MRSAIPMFGIALLVMIMQSALTGCNTIDSERIPGYTVSINLSPSSVWQVYGVHGYGEWRKFVRELQEPSNFSWTERTYTGFGGVLLVCGTDAFTNEAGVPIAYDLSCPVECRREVRVEMVSEDPLPVARCPVCKSRYEVIQAGGRPLSGPALTDNLGLRIYRCVPPANGVGGFFIVNQ